MICLNLVVTGIRALPKQLKKAKNYLWQLDSTEHSQPPNWRKGTWFQFLSNSYKSFFYATSLASSSQKFIFLDTVRNYCKLHNFSWQWANKVLKTELSYCFLRTVCFVCEKLSRVADMPWTSTKNPVRSMWCKHKEQFCCCWHALHAYITFHTSLASVLVIRACFPSWSL